MRQSLTAALILLVAWRTSTAAAQADPTSRSWNQPVEPYRIVGNVYYVGASDITSFLITTPAGHILLDGGFAETVPLIRQNLEKLGFALKDVKILINSHAHYDHAGGLAALKELTGAQLAANEGDVALLARGGKEDPHIGDSGLFRPIQADRILRHGDRITLGGVTLTAHHTPGHTPGNTTWTMTAREGEKTYAVVFAASTSILPGVKLTNNAKYLQVAEDYATAFRVLNSLPCDVFLAPHASFYKGLEKAERLRQGAKENPFVDPQGFREYVERGEKRFRELLEKERSTLTTPTPPLPEGL